MIFTNGRETHEIDIRAKAEKASMLRKLKKRDYLFAD